MQHSLAFCKICDYMEPVCPLKKCLLKFIAMYLEVTMVLEAFPA